MKRFSSAACATLICFAWTISHASGQAVSYNWLQVAPSSWNDDFSWEDPVNNQFFTPDGTQFEERAVINNGGIAFVISGDQPPAAGAILISNGTAEVRSGTLGAVVTPLSEWDGSVTLNGGGNSANLIVLPGGTLSSQGLLRSAANAANNITIGGTASGTATVNVPAAVFQGTTRVYPNAAFNSTGSVTITGGTYIPEINGANSASLNIGQNAILGGTLNANFSGPIPSVGASWELLEADSIVNDFFTITSNLTLPANQRLLTNVFPVGSDRFRMDLELSEVLCLTVNRDFGTLTIDHSQGTTEVNLDSYTISSSEGRLVSGNFNSVSSQGALGGGWDVSTLGAGSFSELHRSGDGLASAASKVSLGRVYDALAGNFAGEDDDISFEYSDSEGRFIQGIVKYVGTKLNNLLLQIDPGSGEAWIRNTSETTVDVFGYNISSTSSITPGTWDSLEDQGEAGGDWLEFTNPSPAQIGELKIADSTTLAPGASYQLGTIFDTNAARDLTFEFVLEGDEVATFGSVVYEPLNDADIDNDGDVDGRDTLTILRSFGQSVEARSSGDTNGDGVVNAIDVSNLESQLGAGRVVGAVSAVADPVPEPAGVILIVLVMGLLLSSRISSRASLCPARANSGAFARGAQFR